MLKSAAIRRGLPYGIAMLRNLSATLKTLASLPLRGLVWECRAGRVRAVEVIRSGCSSFPQQETPDQAVRLNRGSAVS